MRGPFEVVELPALHRPPEPRADQEHQHDGERDQEQQDVHRDSDRSDGGGTARRRATRSAFATTASDESDMPAAATSGVTRPIAAAGIAIALYANAHARFCRITRNVRRACAIASAMRASSSPSTTTSA